MILPIVILVIEKEGNKMALGTNYKRNSGPNHPIVKRLKAHHKRMLELMEQGHDKDDASRMAFKEITSKKEK